MVLKAPASWITAAASRLQWNSFVDDLPFRDCLMASMPMADQLLEDRRINLYVLKHGRIYSSALNKVDLDDLCFIAMC